MTKSTSRTCTPLSFCKKNHPLKILEGRCGVLYRYVIVMTGISKTFTKKPERAVPLNILHGFNLNELPAPKKV